MTRFLIGTVVLFCSCVDSIELNRQTKATNKEPFTVNMVDPNGPGNFYTRLNDSLNQHILALNKVGLAGRVIPKGDPDFFLDWLQDQFEDEFFGLGNKASSDFEVDRTSKEFAVENENGSKIDKVSFTVRFMTDSIPDDYLYPDLWTRKHLKKKVEIDREKMKFERGGTKVRTTDGKKDTLYGYPYHLAIEFTMNYFQTIKGKWVRSKFRIPCQTVVYHQLRIID
jgi:hypothetical protein